MDMFAVLLLWGVPILLAMALVAVLIAVAVRASGPQRPPANAAEMSALPGAGTAAWWYVHVMRPDALDPLRGFGRLVVAGGTVTFVPDDPATTAGWQYPATSFGVRQTSMLSRGGLELDSAPTGPLVLEVSREHINRAMTNTLKDMREREYAAEAFAVLTRAGAVAI